MSGDTSSAADRDAQDVKAYEDANTKAGDDVRAVAKWIVGGITGTAVGVIAGSLLTSLGALGWEVRLLVAGGAAALGFAMLGFLLWFALGVITPRSYSMPSIAAGKDITPRRLRRIEPAVANLLPTGITSLEKFVTEGLRLAREASRPGATDDVKRQNAEYRRKMHLIRSSLIYEHLLLLFGELKNRVFALTPLIALAFGIFAWAAGPHAATSMKPYVKHVTVASEDVAALSGILSASDCPKKLGVIDVVVLSERSSGAEDVITTAQGNCPPVRLRLDGGRLTGQ
jgi:hypothetical protein